ncbi:MAG: hypothetical protein J5640_08735 [Bacteroidales bacterium]|nr:hypothetical protein [Bacteroidales bacterium]
MNKLLSYYIPKCEAYEVHWEELLCDSYDSGIDDFLYQEVDWTVNP